MLAFTKATIPAISASLDFFNVMIYDLMNRRDNVTKHYIDIAQSLAAINAYEERGIPTNKMNLGFAFHIKWYRTDPHGECDINSIGCKITLMEDPLTGADLSRADVFSWHESVSAEVSVLYKRVMAHGKYNSEGGDYYYLDSEESL